MKYVLAVLGVIVVAVLAIVLITRGPSGKKNPAAPKKVVISQQDTDSTSAIFTTQGKVVGEEQFRAIRITVSQDERRLEILTGYDGTVSTSQVYPNTPSAYSAFLTSIEKAGFGLARKTTTTDPTGVCPLGRRSVYELKDYDQKLINLWNTSCGAKIGSFGGRAATVNSLFRAQIPKYQSQVKGVSLSGTND
ncbi:MAG TPA: hypothetical protein VK694_01975 [Verrucomicrobiae bacterium]|nr:hypothetical protein [Verrucomicrobiae bacterium]